MGAHRSGDAAEAWRQTDWFVGESIEADILSVEYHEKLPSLESFIDQCAQLALARQIFEKYGVEAETILVPRNLSMKAWENLFTTQFLDGSKIYTGDTTKNMTVDRESQLAGVSWGIALVNSGDPTFSGHETARMIEGIEKPPLVRELKDGYIENVSSPGTVIKQLSPSLEVYLAYQLHNVLSGNELVDKGQDWTTHHTTIGRASLLAEDAVVPNVDGKMVIKSLCAGSNSLHPPHRLWIGAKDLGSLSPEIGFRPTITAKN